MQILSLLTLSLFLLSLSSASPVTGSDSKYEKKHKPAAFLLAGDSTTAPRGGWGNEFLKTLQHGAVGTNFARSGRTTVDFRSLGDWAQVIGNISLLKDDYRPFVTIQFGHNDQKPEKNITITDFKNNLVTFIKEVRKAGGSPIIVSSLTRRTFNESLTPPAVIENLAEHSAAALSVAKQQNTYWIDLNRRSTDYINAIGQVNADAYNLRDRTHLGAAGEVFFGHFVAGLVRESRVHGLGRKVGKYLNVNETIWEAIQSGTFILPSV